ncbi:MAG: hypothetical protein R3C56_00835 [Pirellulaceae bacterium]
MWSLLQPADATSVFQGTAIPQNLGWLVLATLTASGCIACGVAMNSIGVVVLGERGINMARDCYGLSWWQQ